MKGTLKTASVSRIMHWVTPEGVHDVRGHLFNGFRQGRSGEVLRGQVGQVRYLVGQGVSFHAPGVARCRSGAKEKKKASPPTEGLTILEGQVFLVLFVGAGVWPWAVVYRHVQVEERGRFLQCGSG